MKVTNELNIYEVDGKDSFTLDIEKLKIKSHWNYNDRVVLELNGKTVTVLAQDLKNAITNATNHKR